MRLPARSLDELAAGLYPRFTGPRFTGEYERGTLAAQYLH
jgi:hypothetical protein